MTPRELPPGWEEVQLSDIGTWTGGGTPSKRNKAYWDGDIPWVSPKDMKRVRLKTTQDHVSAAAVQESAAKLFPRGSIAFVVRSGILEHTLPVALIDFEATANQDMRILTPRQGINRDWLLYALLGAAETIRRSCRKDGTTVASIDVPSLQRYAIGLPPREEQDRIVSAVNALFEPLAEGDAPIHDAYRKQEALKRSALRKLLNVPGATVMRLGDVCDVRSGAGFPKALQGRSSGDIPFGKVRDISAAWQRGAVRLDSAPDWISSAEAENRIKAAPFPAGTTVMAKIGEAVKLNRRAILGREMLMDNNCMGWIPRTDLVEPEFLFHVSRTVNLDQLSHATAVPSVRKSDVLEISVAVPSLEEQQIVICSIKQHEERCAAAEAAVGLAQAESAALRRSILNAALQGHLVRQDPAEEPASALLKDVSGAASAA